KNGGDGRYRGAPVDVSNLTERITRLLKPIAGRKDVELSVDITAGLPPITGDADALTQLLWNILQNAIAHSGGRFVELCVKPGDGGIIITVKDDGRGISPDLLPRVFERGISGAVEGSGIGLSVCRDIARRHGGDIIMESVQGKGTRVTVSLPVTEGGDPAA
ncbi:MAG: HAMP domain-containing histidine kinase, partial [Chitinispirillales bacterium]|nr:HAMP domain-containing histidine kinase [Chitinispirillales bacterium]